MRLIVIGGGASGALLAVHALRGASAELRILLIEKRVELGAGAAYATNHPAHLLNVRASNMSAFPDDPDDFVRWLRQIGPAGSELSYGAGCFAPRHLYREYLGGVLAPLLADGRLLRIHAEALGVRVTGTAVEIDLDHGSPVRGDAAVIATGNEGPSLEPAPWRLDGWGEVPGRSLRAEAPVVVIGTGLTMIDRALTLLHTGHQGPITAVSRRGLVPHTHRGVPACVMTPEEIPLGAPLRSLIGWTRGRAREMERSGADWRSLIDALRPYTVELWQQLSLEDRRRFLRHARPFWDIHRHRIAPDAAQAIEAARRSGQFRSVAARVIGFEPRGKGVDVRLAHRGSGRPEVVHAEAVYECRGRSSDITGTVNPVLRNLLASGAARPDALGLGLAVTRDCALLDRDGRASERLYGIGPITSGTFWEIVAIPDIRSQAARLAARLAQLRP